MRNFILIVALLVGVLSIYTAKAADLPKFALTTQAFSNAGTLPILYTCDGKDKSPDFAWTNPPAKTKTFALVVTDPDAPNGIFYHWTLFNIPKNIAKLEAGITQLPTGALTAKNSEGKSQYKGPCPPKGATHTYIFTIYALDSTLLLSESTDAKTVVSALNKHALQQTQLTAAYGR